MSTDWDALADEALELESGVGSVETLPPLAPVASPAKPPAPAAPSPWDALADQAIAADEAAQEQEVGQLRWLEKNNVRDPEQAGELLRYSAAARLPIDQVALDLPAVKRNIDAQQTDWDRVYRENPVVAQFARQPGIMPLVKDDWANLPWFEWGMKMPFRVALDATKALETTARQIGEYEGWGSEENRQRIRELEVSQAKDYGANSFFAKAWIGLPKMAPFILGDLAARVAGGAAGALAGPGGLVAGQYSGSALFNYYQSIGPLYWQLIQIPGMTEDKARWLARGASTVTAGLMAGFFQKASSAIPGVKSALEKAGALTVQKALTSATVPAALGQGLKQWGKHEAVGASLMAAQSAINQAALELGKAPGPWSESYGFEADPGEVFRAGLEGLKTGATDMLLFSASGPGKAFLKELGRIHNSEVNYSRVLALSDAAQASTAMQRFPQGVRELMAELKQTEGAVQDIHFDRERFNAHCEKLGLDPGEVWAGLLGDEGKAYQEATETGAETLTVPVELALEKMARSEAFRDFFRTEGRIEADGMTGRELAELHQKMDEAAKVPVEKLEEPSRKVYDDVFQKAREAGRGKAESDANAKITVAWFDSLAKRLTEPTDPWELYSRFVLRIGRGDHTEAGALAQKEAAPGNRAMDQAYATAEASYLNYPEAERKGLQSRDYFIDPTTELLGEQALRDLPADPNRPMVGILTFPFKKPINDIGGHESLDALFADVGRVLHSIDPDIAKVGGEFVVPRLKDEATLKEMISTAKKALAAELPPEVLAEFDLTGVAVNREKDHRATVYAAQDALKEHIEKRRTTPDEAGKLWPGREQRPGFDAAAVEFKGKKGRAAIPDELRALHAGLDEKQAARKIFLKPNGCLTMAGWERQPEMPVYASFDLRAFGETDKSLGHVAADEINESFGALAVEIGGDKFVIANPSGDEYRVGGQNEAELRAFLDVLGEEAIKIERAYRTKSGGIVAQNGVFFTYGVAKSFHDADKVDLPRNKAELGKAGRGKEWFASHIGVVPRERSDSWLRDAELRRDRALAQRRTGLTGRGSAKDEGSLSRDPLREVAETEGFPLADLGPGKVKLPQGDRGSISFALPGSTTPREFRISLFATANQSTLTHELSHFFAEVLGDVASTETASPDLIADYDALLKWMGHASHEERTAATRERVQLAALVEKTPEQAARLKELASREERFAFAWEQYLAEGKEPAEPGLAGVFALFSRWMVKIYKGLQSIAPAMRGVEGVKESYRKEYGREIELSDDVRAIFHRLLTAEDRAEEARKEAGQDAWQWLRERLSPEEQAEYDRVVTDHQDEARRQLVARLAADKSGAASMFLDEERSRLRGEAEAELADKAPWRALRLLSAGEMRLADGSVVSSAALPEPFRLADGRALKIDWAAAKKVLGLAAIERLPEGIFTSRGGAHPEEVASLLGYASAHAMAEDLAKANKAAVEAAAPLSVEDPARLPRTIKDPYGAYLEAEVSRRLTELFGPSLIDDPGRLGEEALSAVHTTKAARKLLLELRHLTRLMDPSQSPRMRQVDLAKLKEHAERLIDERKIRDLQPNSFLRSERAQARKALELAADGDLQGAYDAKELQLLNQLLFDSARKKLERAEKLAARLGKTGEEAWRKALGKASPTYRDVHDSLLEALGLKEPERGEPQPRQGIDALLVKMLQDASGASVERVADPRTGAELERLVADNWDSELVRDILSRPRDHKELTPAELEEVQAAVKNIRKMANADNEVTIAGKRAERTALLEEAAREAAANLPEQPAIPRDELAGGAGKKALRDLRLKVQSWDANLLTMETMVDMLSGGKKDTVFRRLLVDGYQEARRKKEELSSRYLTRITDLWEKLPKAMRARRYETVDLSGELPIPDSIETLGEGPSTRTQLWMIALNMGNRGNKQRLLDGYQWTEDQVMRVLKRELSAEEWKWVQGVWDSLEDLYPEIARVHEEATGLKPGKVLATPVVGTAAGDLRGGYFPARYDPRIPSLGFQQTESQIAGLFAPGYRRPVVQHSHSKKRAVKFTDVVSLDWSVLPSHVAQVLHDISFREYVRNTATILLDKRWQFLAQRYLGEERAKQFVPWLQAVANAQADAVPAHLAKASSLLSWMKNRAAAQAIGHSIGVALGDLSNPLLAAASGEVRPRYLALATAKMASDFRGARKMALEASPELRHRASDYAQKLRLQLGLMGGSPGLENPTLRAVRESAYFFMEQTDKLTATPIWLAKYHQALGEGRADADAVKDADATVRKLFPAQADPEKAAWLRDHRGMASLLMFYGFMNKVYNLNRLYVHDVYKEWNDEAATPVSKATAVAKATGKLLATAMVVGAASEFLSGRGKEDDETWEEWLARKTLVSPLSTVPFVGQAVEGVFLRKQISIRNAPALSLMQSAAQSVQRLLKAAEAGDADAAKTAWDTVELLGLAAGIPTRQPRKTLEYLGGVASGAESPRGPGDVVGGVIYGKRKANPANLGTVSQDLIDRVTGASP
jgi:GGDEF domain-containing protein